MTDEAEHGPYRVWYLKWTELQISLNRAHRNGWELVTMMDPRPQSATVAAVVRNIPNAGFRGERHGERTPMTPEQFEQLSEGDIVRHVHDWRGFVVHANYGKRGVVIVRTQLATIPSEWELVRKAEK